MAVDVTAIKPGDVVMVRIQRHGWQDGSGSKRTIVRPARVIEVYRRFCTVLLYRGREAIRESPNYQDIEAINPSDVPPEAVPPMPGSLEAREAEEMRFASTSPPTARQLYPPIESQEPSAPEPPSEFEAPRSRKPRQPVTDEDIERVDRLMQEGLGAVLIARALGITVNRAQHIMRTVKERRAEELERMQQRQQEAAIPTLPVEELAEKLSEQLRPVIRQAVEDEVREAVMPLLYRVEQMEHKIETTADLMRLRRELATVGGMINRALQRLDSGVRSVG